MTAAIMSAVPPRRAGAGSAMNDATRELGAALGIAVMGSVAASQYTHKVDRITAHMSAATRHDARVSIADALQAADKLHEPFKSALTTGAEHAFIDGVHLAVTSGAVLALLAAVIVWRNLPRSLAPESAMHGPIEAMENTAELGLGGVLPAFADGDGDVDVDDAGAEAQPVQ
jgi:hypothetical protein